MKDFDLGSYPNGIVKYNLYIKETVVYGTQK